jgi:large subunit ribosomal protein L23
MNISVIKKPIITEKSLLLASQSNTYVFEVDRLANRKQVAEAVSSIFEVVVLSVRTTLSHKKVQRTGKRRMSITKAPTKKAFVTVKKGQTIDLFDITGNK